MKIRLDDVMQSLSYPYDAVYLYYIPLETVLMFRNGRIFGKAVHGIGSLEDAAGRAQDFIALPDLGPEGRGKVMRSFAQTLPEGDAKKSVMKLVQETDDEQTMEYILRRENLLLDWFSYREQIYREFSRKWCEEKGLAWIE